MPDLTLMNPKWFTEEGWDGDEFSSPLFPEFDKPRSVFDFDGDNIVAPEQSNGVEQVDNVLFNEIEEIFNAYCPTGLGGGQDNSCGPHSSDDSGGAEENDGTPREVLFHSGTGDKKDPIRVGTSLKRALEELGKGHHVRLDGGKKNIIALLAMVGKSVTNVEELEEDEDDEHVANELSLTWESIFNVFCPTGEGGGIDPSCTLYRGENSGNKGSFGNGRHYTSEKEWARQFTQSGQEHEIKSVSILKKDIYVPEKSVYAGDEIAMDSAIVEAKSKGFKAVQLSEGENEPPSTFVFDRRAFTNNVFCPTGTGGGVDASCSPIKEGMLAGSKGIERRDMPQLRKKDQDKMVDWMEEHGVKVTADYVRTSELKPIQKEYDPKKVEDKPLEALDKPIIVSKGGRILDGTHHWLKAKEVGKNYLPVIKLHVSWDKAMELMHQFPKTFKADLLANAMYQSNGQEFWVFPNELTLNVFCPTGPGGGIDATCSPGESGQPSPAEMGEPKIIKGQAWLPFVDPEDVNQWQLNARAVKAVEQVKAELENVIGERVKEYESWADVPEYVQSEYQSEWENDNYSTYVSETESKYFDDKEQEIRDEIDEDDEGPGKASWEGWAMRQEGFKEEWLSEFGIRRGDSNFAYDSEEFAEWMTPGKEAEFNKVLWTDLGNALEERMHTEREKGLPDRLKDGIYENLSDDWFSMRDSEKLNSSGLDNKYTKVKEPENYEPFEGGSDYKATQLIARELQANLTVKELEARGLKMDSSFDPKHLAKEMWGGNGWVGSSTSPNGLLIQHASALELGGHKQEWDADTQGEIDKAAEKLAQAYLAGNMFEADRIVSPGIKDKSFKEAGIEIAKAHVAATWAVTQHILDQAGERMVNLYRGLKLRGMDNQRKEEVYQRTVGDKLPDLQLKRNGAASAAYGKEGLRVANDWGGVGAVPKDAQRVVLRMSVPKESILSLPAFGKNTIAEREVVITGNKYKWDAFLDKAPSLEDHPHGKQ